MKKNHEWLFMMYHFKTFVESNGVPSHTDPRFSVSDLLWMIYA